MQTNLYCNNCGKSGHVFNLCKMPITSIGIIAFRKTPQNVNEYLMICRKDTLGHIDFMRGKYNIHDKQYILNMLNQMTRSEKETMKLLDFDLLWNNVWSHEPELSPLYKNEESASREKFNTLCNGVTVKKEHYTLLDLIEESNTGIQWEEPEWGFPKGRRNSHEKDYDCALREFEEETGISRAKLRNVQNVLPFEEIFTGSNYKSYKHKYYIMGMNYNDALESSLYQKSEVSNLQWKKYEQCLEVIRDYNVEKKNILTKVHNTLTKYMLIV